MTSPLGQVGRHDRPVRALPERLDPHARKRRLRDRSLAALPGQPDRQGVQRVQSRSRSAPSSSRPGNSRPQPSRTGGAAATRPKPSNTPRTSALTSKSFNTAPPPAASTSTPAAGSSNAHLACSPPPARPATAKPPQPISRHDPVRRHQLPDPPLHPRSRPRLTRQESSLRASGFVRRRGRRTDAVPHLCRRPRRPPVPSRAVPSAALCETVPVSRRESV